MPSERRGRDDPHQRRREEKQAALEQIGQRDRHADMEQLFHRLAIEPQQVGEDAVVPELRHPLHIGDDEDQVNDRHQAAAQAHGHRAHRRRAPITVHEDVVEQERQRQAHHGADGDDQRPAHHRDEVAQHGEPIGQRHPGQAP